MSVGWGRSVRRTASAVVLLAATLVGVLGTAGPALAHFGGGQSPSNYAESITSITPSMPGVTVSVVDNGDFLDVVNTSDATLVVYGYDHRAGTTRDPYLKITSDAVWVNQNSGAAYLNKTRFGTTSPPTDPKPDAAPDWVKERDEGRYRWHDHRTHWMTPDVLPPVVAAAPDQPHVVIDGWTAAMRYDETPVTVTGRLDWVPPPSTVPWWAVVGIAFVAAFAVGLVRQWRSLTIGSLLLLAVADVVHLATSPYPTDPSEGSRAFAIVAAAVPTVAIVGLAVLAVRAVRRGNRAARFPMAAAGLLAAVQAASDVTVIWRSQLPQTGPDWLARVSVSVAVGLGVGLFLAAFVLGHRERRALLAQPTVRSLDAGSVA